MADPVGRQPAWKPVVSFVSWLPFVLTAGAASLVVHASLSRTWLALVVLSALLACLSLLYIRHVRLRQAWRRGDVASTVASVLPTLSAMPHRETMGPIALATIFAGYGQAREARATMASAQRGPIWDGALEHRLFVEALLALLDGDVASAKDQVAHMTALPERTSSRTRTLREAMTSLTRAFGRESQPADIDRLEVASRAAPSVGWIMRYGAAIAAYDQGELVRARQLIATAPSWPNGSRLRQVHAELASLLADC